LSENKSIAALILAAGNSERMGQNKASLPYGNGLTFAGQLVSVYDQASCSPIIMVINNKVNHAIPNHGKVQFVLNEHVEKGRSWSIWLGLQRIPCGHSCFIQNIDNPYANPVLLSQMCETIKPEQYIVPVFDGRGGHPILLGCTVVDELRKRSDIGNLREALKEFVRFEVLTSDEQIHLNINTPEDYLNFIKQS
jgi:molybdenum cofactor cytidylyltransferase